MQLRPLVINLGCLLRHPGRRLVALFLSGSSLAQGSFFFFSSVVTLGRVLLQCPGAWSPRVAGSQRSFPRGEQWVVYILCVISFSAYCVGSYPCRLQGYLILGSFRRQRGGQCSPQRRPNALPTTE